MLRRIVSILYPPRNNKALANGSSRTRDRGFTLVELLVVIVVIAIIAAISVASFSGVKDRANAARAAQLASQYARILKLYYADNNKFPPSTGISGSLEVCWGYPSEFPASGSFQAGQCVYNPDGYRVDAWQPLMDAIQPYASSASGALLPMAALQNESWRGFRYVDFTKFPPIRAQLEWIIPGNHLDWCAPGKGSLYNASTWCIYTVTPS